jgi:hypothetical protein
MSPTDAVKQTAEAGTAVAEPRVRDHLQAALARELDTEAQDRDRRWDADGAPMFSDT